MRTPPNPANDNATDTDETAWDDSPFWPEHDDLPEGAWDPMDPYARRILERRYPEIYGSIPRGDAATGEHDHPWQ